jgi:disulfide oxidoreductase YuzD
MDLLNTESRSTEHFDFGSSAADLQSTQKSRNVKNEITNKGFDPEAVIDAYEQAKGIKRRSKPNEAENYEFKNIILDPEQQRDQDMLNELMNNKKYMITLWKDTWTTQGNFRVFIIYGAKKEEKK